MELTERAAYIKGLMDGMKLDEEKNEAKVLRAISELLCDVTKEIEVISQENDELFEKTDELDEAIDVLLEDVYGEDDILEAECPKCNAVFVLKDHMIDNGEIVCPSCGYALEVDLDGQEFECCKNDCCESE